MSKIVLILDLDDTIFKTKSIDKQVVDPFFSHLICGISSLFNKNEIEQIQNDLWKYSWDVVIEKHQIPKNIFHQSIKVFENLPLNFDIATYSDYRFLKSLNTQNFLVTTGLTSLQNAKIKALNIENDFKEIIINDRLIETKTKLDIFRELINKYNFDPKYTFVIGDNPNSEIEAGNVLGLNTIQILRENVEKGNNAKYYIKTFEDLNDDILKK